MAKLIMFVFSPILSSLSCVVLPLTQGDLLFLLCQTLILSLKSYKYSVCVHFVTLSGLLLKIARGGFFIKTLIASASNENTETIL